MRITLEKHFEEFWNLTNEMGKVPVSGHSVRPEADRLLVGDFFLFFYFLTRSDNFYYVCLVETYASDIFLY